MLSTGRNLLKLACRLNAAAVRKRRTRTHHRLPGSLIRDADAEIDSDLRTTMPPTPSGGLFLRPTRRRCSYSSRRGGQRRSLHERTAGNPPLSPRPLRLAFSPYVSPTREAVSP